MGKEGAFDAQFTRLEVIVDTEISLLVICWSAHMRTSDSPKGLHAFFILHFLEVCLGDVENFLASLLAIKYGRKLAYNP